MDQPDPDEAVVRLEALPINPSDLMPLFAAADPTDARWAMPQTMHGSAPSAPEMQGRLLAGIRTTFASRYTREISLAETLDRETMIACARMATGEKVLINPTL